MNDTKYAKETKHYHLHQKYNRYGYGIALSMCDDEMVRENRIVDITPSGIRQTYKITTKSGSSIVCTDNHKFPTKNGEVKLSNLKVGDKLYCLGKYKHKKFDSSLTDGNFESNVPIKGQMGFQYKPNGAFVIYDEVRLFHKENKCCCEICNKEYSENERFELHHKDLDRKNNDRNNFQWLCVSCHKKEHYKNGRTKRYEKGIPTYLDEIISIEPYKTEQTYNVEMGDPNHNFISESGLITSNSAHAYCMGVDSVTLAWQKAYYPLEFYKVTLQRYTNKGKKDKVSLLKQEMLKRGISLRPIKFGEDNRQFSIDRDNNCINQTMSSIKNMQKITPNAIYEIGLKGYKDFFNVLKDMKEFGIDKTSRELLIKLDYFSQFGHPHQLLSLVDIYAELSTLYNKFKTAKKPSKSLFEQLSIPLDEVATIADKETPKQFTITDNIALLGIFKRHYKQILKQVSAKYPFLPTTTLDKIKYEVELLGYTDLIDESVNDGYYIVCGVETNQWGTAFSTLYQISSGYQQVYKVDKKYYQQYPFKVGNILNCFFDVKQRGHYETIEGQDKKKWVLDDEYETILKKYSIK